MIARLFLTVSLIISLKSYAGDISQPNGQNGNTVVPCVRMEGRLVTSWTVAGCASPYGLCTAGSVVGGPYHGASAYFTVTAIGPTPEDPTLANSLAYNGPLVLKATSGELSVQTMGLFDKNNALTTSQSRSLTGGSGHVVTVGVATATGFDSQLQGKVCLTP